MLLPSRASIPAIHRSIVNKLHVYFELTTYTNLKRLAEQAPRRRNARQQGGDVAADGRAVAVPTVSSWLGGTAQLAPNCIRTLHRIELQLQHPFEGRHFFEVSGEGGEGDPEFFGGRLYIRIS